MTLDNHAEDAFTSTAFKTDHYEFTMVSAALKAGTADRRVTFELFARKLPKGRRYGVVAGVDRAIEAVMNFRFTEEQISYLSEQPGISEELIARLKAFRFEGSVTGLPEGSLYFPYTPILTVEGTFLECVLLETVLLSIYNHDSAIASAASRMVQATEGKFPLIEMGSRRAHEESAVSVARAAYIAGFAATSNVEAGVIYGIPITGTAAHAFTLSFESEIEAFEAQVNALGVGTTLLVDTYDIEQGIRNAIKVAGPELGAIRIDSGDLHDETVKARELLDSLGAVNTKIILSSDIDEYSLANMVERETPVNGAGAGTRVATGSGHPTCGMVYKLVEREDEHGNMVPVAKRAVGKKSLGGRKTVFRTFDNSGNYDREFIILPGERVHLTRALGADNFEYLQDSFILGGRKLPDYLLTDKETEKIGILKNIENARNRLKLELSKLPKSALSTLAGEPVLEAEVWQEPTRFPLT